MSKSEQIEELIGLALNLDRDALVAQFRTYPATFPIDFTADFFTRTPLERLRHIYVAMCLTHRFVPPRVETAA